MYRKSDVLHGNHTGHIYTVRVYMVLGLYWSTEGDSDVKDFSSDGCVLIPDGLNDPIRWQAWIQAQPINIKAVITTVYKLFCFNVWSWFWLSGFELLIDLIHAVVYINWEGLICKLRYQSSLATIAYVVGLSFR